MLWDLSAAFDTLNPKISCDKLKIYGFDKLSCDWFMSFLTGRAQKVKIGKTLSSKIMLESGVPQGGILSPVFFVIYANLVILATPVRIIGHQVVCLGHIKY